jgi:predicted dehydrogenase
MYRAAIVGCGRIGCGFDDDPRRKHVSTHAGAYARTPGVELVALSDLDAAKLDRYGDRFQVQGRYLDYREMLRREAVDILSVCTWSPTHRQITEDAVAAGVKAVFCEKPIAESLEAADAMVRCCARAGVLLMVNCQRRFDPMHQQLAGLLRDGRLGKVQQVTCYYSGGVANNGAHVFDVLRFLFGEVAWVQGTLSENPSPSPDDPNLDGCMKFHSGLLGVVQACDSSQFSVFELNILAARGRLAIRRFGLEVQFEEVRQSEQFSEDRDFYPATPPVQLGSQEFMLHAVAHVVDCLQHQRTPICSGEDGRRALELIVGMLTSARDGSRRVAMPLTSSSMVISSR